MKALPCVAVCCNVNMKILFINLLFYLFLIFAIIFSSITFSGTFAKILITLYCLQYLPEELNSTSIFPSPPGGIGFLSYLGVVQPQLASTFRITRLLVPVFLKRNVCVTISPSCRSPKLNDFCGNSILAIVLESFTLVGGVLPVRFVFYFCCHMNKRASSLKRCKIVPSAYAI